MTTSTDIADLYRKPVTLEGQHVRLVPLTLEYAASLFRALNGDEELWRYIPVEQPRTLAAMRGWIGTALEEHTQQGRVPFAKEGVLRKAQILHDGHERSVVLYALLDEEWPSRKAWFEETLRR